MCTKQLLWKERICTLLGCKFYPFRVAPLRQFQISLFFSLLQNNQNSLDIFCESGLGSMLGIEICNKIQHFVSKTSIHQRHSSLQTTIPAFDFFRYTLKCLSIGTPNTTTFTFVPNRNGGYYVSQYLSIL